MDSSHLPLSRQPADPSLAEGTGLVRIQEVGLASSLNSGSPSESVGLSIPFHWWLKPGPVHLPDLLKVPSLVDKSFASWVLCTKLTVLPLYISFSLHPLPHIGCTPPQAGKER